MLIAVFLCSSSSSKFLEELKPEWNQKVHLPVEEKINFLNAGEEVENLFPLLTELSGDIDPSKFQLSFLIQPDLFLRARPGRKNVVTSQLKEAGISFTTQGIDAIQLASQTRIDEIIMIDRDAVVQDLNSQRVLEPLEQFVPEKKKNSVWDCCAASGGKSILAYDRLSGIQLTVSDIRESILINLKKRLARAGINHYHSFVADVAALGFSPRQKFDLVICDAPCSGSGTWSRTPEQLHFFTVEKIDHYMALQKKIAINAAKAVQQNGCFLYITCSVFRKENEDVVDHILQQQSNLQLRSMQYFKGYDQKADTLFTALFTHL